MTKINWTDTGKGRQFWAWNDKTQEWEKTVLLSWDEVKARQALSLRLEKL